MSLQSSLTHHRALLGGLNHLNERLARRQQVRHTGDAGWHERQDFLRIYRRDAPGMMKERKGEQRRPGQGRCQRKPAWWGLVRSVVPS